MYEEPKTFPAEAAPGRWHNREAAPAATVGTGSLLTILQLTAGFALIEAALWTPLGRLGAIWIALASLCILGSVLGGDYSAREMGLALPAASSSGWILLGGIVLCATIPILAIALGYHSGPAHILPFRQACLYAVWALVQQFILQSFFYLRLESLLGSKRAVAVTALLFAMVHIPSPILTVGSLLGGLFFCEMFRRYRNIFPLGLAHAMLGLTMAASFSDAVLRHMQVGEAYLSFHP